MHFNATVALHWLVLEKSRWMLETVPYTVLVYVVALISCDHNGIISFVPFLLLRFHRYFFFYCNSGNDCYSIDFFLLLFNCRDMHLCMSGAAVLCVGTSTYNDTWCHMAAGALCCVTCLV